jgi:threonine dehydrogenase-like Zn-dependent dehydrogenase
VLVRIDAVAICATDLEIIWHGPPASIQGGMPFNKNFTPGHEYMGTVAALGPGVDEYRIGQRVTVEVDAYGGREYAGKVDSIAAATGSRFSLLPPENASGNFVKVVQRVPVNIVLDEGQDNERLLRPGMSVTPTVHTK